MCTRAVPALMPLVADRRTFLTEEERYASCVCCGKDLVILPGDVRHGHCFDCMFIEDSYDDSQSTDDPSPHHFLK